MKRLEQLAATLLPHVRPLLASELGLGSAPGAALPAEAIGGLFVTLYDEGGELRGSMGTTDPKLRLPELLPQVARRAAFEDPRFPPLAAEELASCRIAVTVLGGGRRIRGPEEIEPGVTALRVKQGIFSGTTIPEVAFGRGWDAATYLAYACKKAALPPLAWREASTEVMAWPSARAVEPW